MSDAAVLLPTGTVTFLFSDIEGSTRLIEAKGEAYPTLLETHRAIIRSAVESAGGAVFGTEGDAVFAAFDRPSRAVAAAVAAQRGLTEERWPEDAVIRVRMGIHTGEALLIDDDYVGLEVHRAARIAAAAHGGQVLLSETAAMAVQRGGQEGVGLRDLGVHRLKDLSRPERIAQLEIAGLLSEFPTIRTLEATPNNLPLQLTSFVGRDTELAETRALLGRNRLLTLTGPGGTGKTRLALALAAELADDFPDGVRWVPLEPVGDPALVPSAIAEAVEATDVGRPPLERVVAHLDGKRVLLVLDNFEQVVGAAPAIAEILRRTSDTKAIVTSRIPLAISGEQHYPVPSLPMPTPGHDASFSDITASPAVELFVQRAASMRPDFRLTPDNGSAVARIVAGVDGLPLAIELAAARIRLLSPAAIESRLSDRLTLLASTARDLPERQRTIRGAISWSYDLLSEADGRLFARFGVFAGGATGGEVDTVCGPSAELDQDVMDGLESLVDQSLVRAIEDIHGDARFSMYMTIADFARERLAEGGEEITIRERHARAYLDLAETLSGELLGPNRRRATDRLADDHDNLRAAIETFIEYRLAEEAERLVAAIWRFWQFRGHLDEGSRWATRVLAMSDGRAGDGTPRASRIHALGAAGGIAYWSGDRAGSHRPYTEAVGLARELGDQRELGEALFNLSFAPLAEGTDEDLYLEAFERPSLELLDEALAAFRSAGDDVGTARVLWQQGDILSYQSKFDQALKVLEEALALFERHGDHYWAAWDRHMLGLAHLCLGQPEAAQDEFVASLREFDAAGDLSGISLLLIDFAELALARGEEDRMWALLGAALALGRRTGSMLVMSDPPPDVRYKSFDLLRSQPGRREEIIAAAMSMEDAVAFALGGTVT